MLDWEQLVRRSLPGLALRPEEQHELFAELASHLEETYESLRKEGVSEQDAVRRTLSQVTDWNDLQRKIRSARMKENTMNTRVTRFWLPSLITFTLSSVLLAANQIFGPPPTVLRSGKLLLFIPWLLCLPLVGAAGAYLSRRAGAPIGIILVSSLFPLCWRFFVCLASGPGARPSCRSYHNHHWFPRRLVCVDTGSRSGPHCWRPAHGVVSFAVLRGGRYR